MFENDPVYKSRLELFEDYQECCTAFDNKMFEIAKKEGLTVDEKNALIKIEIDKFNDEMSRHPYFKNRKS